MVIDLDIPEPVYLLNSSPQPFLTTLAWTDRTDGGLDATCELRDALLAQSCISPDELDPFWMNIIDANIDCSTDYLGVSLGREQ